MAWDIFCLSSVVLFWITFFSINNQQVKDEAQVLKTSTPLVFLLAAGLTIASLGIIILLFVQQHQQAQHTRDWMNILVGFGGLLLSWTLFHTLFTIHYAHLYYMAAPGNATHLKKGLKFPEEEHPDYLDFAYFSFVNGMTFQVSDVSVTSKPMRVLVLFHCLLAFAFNTVIVALSINLIAALM
ncbi:DUF1345 domain-containing protein [Taibaiella sp. KBW10]|nr:DUF1345 domain-containing protein [Taibaiella sp. KBW10]